MRRVECRDTVEARGRNRLGSNIWYNIYMYVCNAQLTIDTRIYLNDPMYIC